MNAWESLRTAEPLVWTLAWQASASLAAGLAASFALRRRPARGHLALLLAMAAAVAAPILTEAGRRLDWGLWEAPAPAAVAGPRAARAPGLPPRVGPPPPGAAATAEDVAFYGFREARRPFPWRAVAIAAWAVSSGILALRLARAFATARRLAGRSEVVDDASIRADLDAARRVMGVAARPAVARSAELGCPAIWCWSRPPRLLLPAAGEGAFDRAAVFRHELAHWRRRDHLSGLAAEVLVGLLPWHPLAWAARSRLGRLAELACDDWVVATGISPEDYAETLVRLAPRRASAALASVVGGGGLRGRIVRILSGGRREPAAGRRWSAGMGVLAAIVVALVALGRSRPGTEAQASRFPEEGAMAKTLRGRVVGPDGAPLAGAQVRAVGERRPPVRATVVGQERRGPETLIITGPVETDAEGRFEVPAPEGGPRDEGGYGLLASAPGFGLAAGRVAPDSIDRGREIEIRMAREVRVEGRLLAPDGSPAVDVDVRVDGFSDLEGGGSALGSIDRDRPPPEFWPRPARTDADGLFALVAPGDAYVVLALNHPKYAVDEVTVKTTARAETPGAMKAFGIVPVAPTFTRTLRPARPVEGRVTDRETGEPVGDALVTVYPMREHGGQGFPTRTDADGRYRVSGHFADVFHVVATPAEDSGYRIASADRRGWPEGAGALTVDLTLARGRRIAGRVVDADGGRPVAGAVVAYEPLWGNPHRDRSGASGPAVSTDAEGRFVAIGVAGEGFLAVETDDPGRMRGSWTPTGARPNQEGRVVHAQGYAPVVVPEEGEPGPVEIVVRRGVTIEARVVDPDGRPIDAVSTYSGNNALSTRSQSRPVDCPGGVFRIDGADPDRTYRVLFTNLGRRLGGVAELKHRPGGGPVVVTLAATAAVRGRFVSGTDGKPAVGLGIFARALFEAGRPELSGADLFDGDRSEFYANVFGLDGIDHHPTIPDAEGGFRFDGLIPGVGLYVAAGDWPTPSAFPVWGLEPGEDRDLGTLEVPAPRAR